MVELLAVIAIIGVLAALVLLTVGKVRDSARSARCLSNLRQIHAAILLHAGDNKGTLPGPTTMSQGPCYYSSATSTSASLAGLLRDYLPPPREAPERGVNRWMQELFACPGWAAADGYETPGPTSPALTTYVLNLTPWPPSAWPNGSNDVRPFGDTNSASNPLRAAPRRLVALSEFPLEHTWMLTDADNAFLAEVMNYATSESYLDSPAHGSSRNVLFYDGRVEKVSVGSFRRYP